MAEIEQGSTVPRRQLGRYLVEWRTRAGLTQAKAAQLLEMGAASLNRLEHGQNSRIKSYAVQAACDLYGVPGDLATALVGLAKQANVKSWWHQYGDLLAKDFDLYVGLETAATKITSYQPNLVPGLLQSAEYVRTLEHLAFSDANDDEIDRRVEIKMQRQHIVTRKTQPVVLDVVIGEAVLRHLVGSPKTMAEQLRHLADMSTLPNVTVRVLAFAAGFPTGQSMSPFVVLDFGTVPTGEPVEPPVIFLEGAVGGLYLENDDDVRFYHRTYAGMRQAALDAVSSRNLLRQIAREHEQRER